MYVNEVKSGQCDGKAKPEIVKQTVATAFVDGKNGIGFVSQVYMHSRRSCDTIPLRWWETTAWSWPSLKPKTRALAG